MKPPGDDNNFSGDVEGGAVRSARSVVPLPAESLVIKSVGKTRVISSCSTRSCSSSTSDSTPARGDWS